MQPLAQAGPLELSRLPASGVVVALAFLAGLLLARRAWQRTGGDAPILLEMHAVAAPAAILASRLPSLARAFPEFLHDARSFAHAMAAPGSVAWGAAAAALATLAFAWASARPGRFLDASGVTGCCVAGALAGPPWLAAAGLAAALAGQAVAVRAAPGRAALLEAAAAGALLAAPRLLGN